MFCLLIASSTPSPQASCCNHFYYFPVLTNHHQSSPKDRVDIFVVVSKVRDLVMLVVCYWLSWALPEPPVTCGCWLLVTMTTWETEYSKSTLTSQFPTPEPKGSPKFPINLDTPGPPPPSRPRTPNYFCNWLVGWPPDCRGRVGFDFALQVHVKLEGLFKITLTIWITI